jgi:hypothetical protein
MQGLNMQLPRVLEVMMPLEDASSTIGAAIIIGGRHLLKIHDR